MDHRLDEVVAAARALAAGDQCKAQTLTYALCRPELLEGRATDRLTHAFGTALQARIDGGRELTGNLYQSSAGPAEMLSAFQVLVERTPLIRFGYMTANAALHRELRDAHSIHVVDVGIGRGGQWYSWLEAFAESAVPRPFVRLTGIEVAGAEEQLASIASALRRTAQTCGVPFQFDARSGRIEQLHDLELRPGETLAINAGFALHHVPDGDAVEDPSASRDAVLSRLHALAPRVITLVEPDAEHNALPFLERVQEAIAHYGIVFEVFEHVLSADAVSRRVLEQVFFAREVNNIVVGEGPDRVERHERHAAWSMRMRRHGFVPIDLSDLRCDVSTALHLAAPFSMTMNEGALALLWNGRRLITASAWRCAKAD